MDRAPAAELAGVIHKANQLVFFLQQLWCPCGVGRCRPAFGPAPSAVSSPQQAGTEGGAWRSRLRLVAPCHICTRMCAPRSGDVELMALWGWSSRAALWACHGPSPSSSPGVMELAGGWVCGFVGSRAREFAGFVGFCRWDDGNAGEFLMHDDCPMPCPQHANRTPPPCFHIGSSTCCWVPT